MHTGTSSSTMDRPFSCHTMIDEGTRGLKTAQHSVIAAQQPCRHHLRLERGPEAFFSLLFSASRVSNSRCSASRALRRASDGSSSAYLSPASAKASRRSSCRMNASTRNHRCKSLKSHCLYYLLLHEVQLFYFAAMKTCGGKENNLPI